MGRRLPSGHHGSDPCCPGLGSGPRRSGTVARVPLTAEQDQLAVSIIRGMAMDAPLAANDPASNMTLGQVGNPLIATDAVGRVLAEAVAARLSSPNFHSAAMDGIAVQAEQTFGTSETSPRQLQIGQTAFSLKTWRGPSISSTTI